MSIGVPIKLLHEAQNHVVTIELKTGEVRREPPGLESSPVEVLTERDLSLCYIRRTDLPRQPGGRGGQHEQPAARRHRHQPVRGRLRKHAPR